MNGRYLRQIALPQLGPAGQAKLAQARVLIVGAGGLGSPAALYLAAAGVGKLGLIDPDQVALSNLQRQILYRPADIGHSKVEQAQQVLRDFNPEIEVCVWPQRLELANAESVMTDFDLVIDGSDNLPTRYLVNDLCVRQGKPMVYGSVYRFEGQIASFDRLGACYRCLYPKLPAREAVPSCNDAGVIGVLPGMVGVMQASEALRLITGWGPGLSNTLLMIDAVTMHFQKIVIPRQSDCLSCGPGWQDRSLAAEHYPSLVPHLSVAEAQQRLATLTVLDVRETAERELGMIPGLHIPLADLVAQLENQSKRLNSKQPLLVYCQKGSRSVQAVQRLQSVGFNQIWSLEGGFEAWSLAQRS